jgi:hypothetical protein
VLRRSAFLLAAGVLVAACGSDDAPTIGAGTVDGSSTSTSTSASSTSTSATTAPATVQSVDLVLTGAAEVPGPGSSGTAEATLTYDGDQLCLTGTTTGVGAVTNGHVHAGVAGESGPPVVDLGIETDGDGPFEGCARVGAEGGVVLTDPASYYVNLHTAEFPDGAVRAQLA